MERVKDPIKLVKKYYNHSLNKMKEATNKFERHYWKVKVMQYENVLYILKMNITRSPAAARKLGRCRRELKQVTKSNRKVVKI